MENLVIVESPAKAKTIEKILGKDYTVRSSFGHIRDLAKKNLGIDIEHGFTPQYEVSPDKKKVVATRKKSWQISSRHPTRRRWYGLHPMRTVRERPSHGI